MYMSMSNSAPEKIYIHVRANKELGTTWHGKKITNSDIEYVRKDALLEWAEIKQTQCLENSTAHAYFQMFIDKINCM